MKMKEIIIEGYDLSKQNFKGMTPEQYLTLLKFQNFTCPLSGKRFEHSKEQKKFLDIEGRETRVQALLVDHDHISGFIRGILSEKVNLLLDQWEKETYGKLSKPQELSDYQNNPPAFKSIGKVKYK